MVLRYVLSAWAWRTGARVWAGTQAIDHDDHQSKRDTMGTTPDALDSKHSPETRMRIGLEELETFLTVAELGSFSLAAKHLNLSQPSVSGRVQRLEHALGAQLLERTTRRVATTRAGERLRLQAEAALRDLRFLIQDFRENLAVSRHTITIATTQLIAAVALAPVIRRYFTTHPNVNIKIRDVGVSAALDTVSSGMVDFAIVGVRPPDDKFSFQPITQDELVVITPPGHPLLSTVAPTFNEVVKYPILVMDGYEFLREWLDRGYRERGLVFRPAYEVVNAVALLGMVAAGMGITLFPRTLVPREYSSTLGFVNLVDSQVIRSYYIVSSRHRQLGPQANNLLGFLLEVFASSATGWATY